MLLITNILLTILMVFTPQDVTNPQRECATCYVADEAHVFSDAARSELNSRCYNLKKAVGVELTIVTVDSIADDDEVGFAEGLFNFWGIGNSYNNSGLLVVYVTSLRGIRFQTGAGIEGLLPDAYLTKLLEQTMFPLMREGKTDEAFLSAMTELENRLSSDEARHELIVEHVENRGFWWNLVIIYFVIAFFVLIAFSIWFYVLTVRVMKNPNLDNGQRFQAFYPLRQTMWVFTFLFPFPLIYLLFYLFRFRRSVRYNAPVCGLCGVPMHVLSEAEEDVYLSENQQAEENLHSIDYDVWVCPQCGEKKIFSYPDANSNKYKKCPYCGSHSYRFVRESIVKAPTALTDGRGVKIYRCDVCKREKRVEFTIPKAPVVIAGATGHGGGFSGGGGFGGGFTAGGGAGGHF